MSAEQKTLLQSIILRLEGFRGNSLARNAAWMSLGQGAGYVFQAIYFIFLARLLGTVEYGIFAGAFAFANLAAQYSGLGSGMVLLRYTSRDRKVFHIYWGNVLLVTGIVGSGLVVGLTIIAPSLLNPASAKLVFLAAIANCLFAQLTLETARVFQAFELMKITATLNLLTSFLRTAAVIIMLETLHRTTAWNWALVTTTVSAFAALLAFATVSVRLGCPRFQMSLFRKHAVEGFEFSFAISASSVYNDIDKTFLSHYGMNAANGIYSIAYRVIDIATMPIYSIRDAAMPRYFERGRKSLASAAQLSDKLFPKVFLIGALGSVGIFLAAPVIPMVVGHGFDETVNALRWLCLIPLFRSFHQIYGSPLTGADLQRYRTVTQFTAAAINFGLNLLLIPRYSWQGAAWASLATDGSLGLMNFALLKILVHKGDDGEYGRT